MAKFEINIEDVDKLAGLAGAAAVAGVTPAEYVQFVMEKACESYALVHSPTIVSAKEVYDEAVAEIKEKFEPIAEEEVIDLEGGK